jgi:tetratricopeptide (TPR) repeat protein
MADVFVSYARQDRERVKSLVSLLEHQGWSVWWDREIIPGETFERIIDAEIQQARCVIAAWSRDSVNSDWVQAEAGDGQDRGILVPVMFDDVRVPLAFRRTDAADLVGWPRRRNQPEIERFLSGVAQCVDQTPRPRRKPKPQPGRWTVPSLAVAGAIVICVLLYQQYFQPNPVENRDGTVTVMIRPFSDGSDRNLGLEYELERRLRASPGLAARVSKDGGESDYVLTADLHGDVLTYSLVDRNGIPLLSHSVSISDDLADVSDSLTRDLLVKLGRAAEVVSKFSTDVPPDTFRAYLSANRLLRQSISPDILLEAEAQYLEVIEQAPRFAAAYAGLCRTHLWQYIETRESDSVSKAEQNCHRALTLDDQDSTVHVALGMLYRETGLMPRSIDSYRRALTLAPYSTDAMRGLGETLARTDADEEAERWLQDAIEFEPNYWENYHALGSFLFEAGRFEEAANTFLTALTLAPAEARVLNNLGAVSYMTNDFERAVEYWLQAQEIQPSSFTLANLGSAYFFLRDFEVAADKYMQARELSPENHIAWGHVGDALYAGGMKGFRENYRMAIELASRQLTIDPKDRWTMSSLGAYHAALGEKEEALRFVEEAAGEGDMNVVYDAAVSFARLGEIEHARYELERLVGLGYPRELIGRDANFDGIQFSVHEIQ